MVDQADERLETITAERAEQPALLISGEPPLTLCVVRWCDAHTENETVPHSRLYAHVDSPVNRSAAGQDARRTGQAGC
jgi:hypothetical protein